MKAKSVIHFLSGPASIRTPMEAERAASLLSHAPNQLAVVERVTDHGSVRECFVRIGAIAYVEDLE